VEIIVVEVFVELLAHAAKVPKRKPTCVGR